jgi:hypothetical protein
VWATSSLSGRLMVDQTTPVTDGIVRLFRVTDTIGYDSVAVQTVNANGEYAFEKVILDNYQIFGFPDPVVYPDALPTYYEKTIFWEEAEEIIVNESYSNLDIIAEERPGSGPVGTGIIRGLVEEDDGADGGRTKGKKAVGGAGVSVRKVENTGRGKEEILTLIAYVFTGEDGTFEFDKLPTATYRLNIQYPGYPMDPNSFVNIPIGTGLQSEVSVTALVETEGVISVSKVIVTEIWSTDELKVSVYPNPTRDFINLNFESQSTSRKISLFDNSGRIVTEITSGENTIVIDVRNQPIGGYILNISEQGTVRKSFHVVFE